MGSGDQAQSCYKLNYLPCPQKDFEYHKESNICLPTVCIFLLKTFVKLNLVVKKMLCFHVFFSLYHQINFAGIIAGTGRGIINRLPRKAMLGFAV